MQLSLFNDEEFNAEIPLHEFFEAYFECRRNKRTTMNALAFEADYEHKLVDLYEEVKTGRKISEI